MSDVQWYYARADQQFGPITAAELRQLALSNSLLPTDLVWKSGMEEWAPAMKLKGLFPESKSATIADGNSTSAGATFSDAAPTTGAQPPPAMATPIDAAPELAVVERQVSAVARLRRLLTTVQIALWGMCVAVVLIGVVLLALAVHRSNTSAESLTEGAAYSAFFIGAYVIARTGEKISQLILRRVERPDINEP